MLTEQMQLVSDGEEPINIIRDPKENEMIHVDQEGWTTLGKTSDIEEIARYGSKLRSTIIDTLSKTQHASKESATA